MTIIRKPKLLQINHHYIRVKAHVYVTFVNWFKNALWGYNIFVTQSAPLIPHSIEYKCSVTYMCVEIIS